MNRCFSILCILLLTLQQISCMKNLPMFDVSMNETQYMDELHWLLLADAFYHYCNDSYVLCNGTKFNLNDGSNPYIYTPMGKEAPCCAPCTCHQDEMVFSEELDIYDTYCPEVTLINSEFLQRPKRRCQSIYVKHGVPDTLYHLGETGVHMIDRCDLRWKDMADDESNIVLQKCHHPRQFSDIFVRTPVSSIYSEEVFINRYCAECNFVKSIEYWTPSIACTQGTNEMINFDDVITTIEKSTKCNMGFIVPQGFSYAPCYRPMGKCNITGAWDVYDPYIEKACEHYYIPMNVYMNLFCFMCNSKADETFPPCELEMTSSISHSFELILRREFYQKDIMDEGENINEGKCSENEIYDRFQGKCLPIICLSYKVLRKGVCVNAIDTMHGLCYEAFVKMTPTRPVSLTDNEVDVIVHQTIVPLILNSIDKVFTSIRRRKADDVNKDIDDVVDDIVYILNHVIICFNLTSGPSSVDRIDNILKLHGTTLIPNPDIKLTVELDIFTYRPLLIRSNYSNSDFGLTVHPTRVIYTDFRDNVNFHGLFENFPCHKWPYFCASAILTQVYSCPSVPLTTLFYTREQYHFGIVIKELGLRLEWNEFLYRHIDLNDLSVLVCKDRIAHLLSDSLVSSVNASQSYGSVQFPAAFDGIISISCTSVSIACCLLTGLCLSCLKVMQTQSCINNLSLALSLALAQSLFQFGSGQAKHIEKWVCQALGILTHYFWLVAILWMNVCSYHMYKVSRKENTIPTGPTERKKVTIFYWTHCLTLAALPVMANIVIETVRTNRHHIGYGDMLCYITNIKMMGYFFIGSLAIVIGCNIFLFVLTVFKRRKPQPSNTFKQDRDLLVIYVKLSILSGVTWVFGFLSVIYNDVEALGYLFVILNAWQGLYIFVSFVCSSLVSSCLKGE